MRLHGSPPRRGEAARIRPAREFTEEPSLWLVLYLRSQTPDAPRPRSKLGAAVTVVAAIAKDGEILMAADRQTNYVNQIVFGARKIRRLPAGSEKTRKGELLIAASGNGSIPNLLVQHLKVDDLT
jgi:hypothetical protein